MLGISQQTLASDAGISLPTIQNIESGRANPCLKVLMAICSRLGLEMRTVAAAAPWDTLALCGAPISAKVPVRSLNRDSKTLVMALGLCCRELRESSDEAGSERKKEAIEGLLLAIYTHYPSFYKKSIQPAGLIHGFFPFHPSGRVIKLKRQALCVIAGYL
ncbi:MAG: hypothetical protein A2583_03465 [Bdellovibrionales bacterium RIFOXYD1_FULL_53_11]|nr:MAG: hypothetical protein A2583_03465 [Bdellovibrionales bacterium RIFOXYD1_FULL_53_11]